MKKYAYFLLMCLTCLGCKHKHPEDAHQHAHEPSLFAAYNTTYELYGEYSPLIVGKTATILAHFTRLADFKPIDSAHITLTLKVGNAEVKKKLNSTEKKGIYTFEIQPNSAGEGALVFDISTANGNSKIEIPEIVVFATHDDMHQQAHMHESKETHMHAEVTHEHAHSPTYAGDHHDDETMVYRYDEHDFPPTGISFTKEQSWKVDFATGFPQTEPIGEVIKTTAVVQSAMGDEVIIAAKTDGMVNMKNNIVEGNTAKTGQLLFSISGSGLASNNSAVRYAEAQANYNTAKANYERKQELAKDKIVSDKDVVEAKNAYETAKAIYNNARTMGASGQSGTSPISGFIKQVYAKNGSFVSMGQPVIAVAKNHNLVLHAEVSQKYASALQSVKSANIRKSNDDKVYNLTELDGKILPLASSMEAENYLIPVNIQVSNKANFISGSFVELYLKTIEKNTALTIPNKAIVEEQGLFFVFVQVTPELFEKREVKTGITDGIKTEILSGLSTHERIVTKGAFLVKLAQSSGALDPHAGHVH